VYEVISTESYTSELGPGDTLVMYTDGVTERPNGDVSAQRDVAGLLAGAETCSVPQLLARIEVDISPGSLLDDAAIVVLRITPCAGRFPSGELLDDEGGGDDDQDPS
jgi:serine phosphatase RsbU (regulator of sigma subunit)